jgi:hypothetical protein
MLWFIAKTLIAALLIAFASWLAGKKPELAGYIIALPLTSMIAIALSYTEHGSLSQSAAFARSILVAVPLSLLFFAPFFVAEKWGISFWPAFGMGIALCLGGYLVHGRILSLFGKE